MRASLLRGAYAHTGKVTDAACGCCCFPGGACAFLTLLASGATRAVRKDKISAPLDFVHEVHVGFDTKTGEFSVGARACARHVAAPRRRDIRANSQRGQPKTRAI